MELPANFSSGRVQPLARDWKAGGREKLGYFSLRLCSNQVAGLVAALPLCPCLTRQLLCLRFQLLPGSSGSGCSNTTSLFALPGMRRLWLQLLWLSGLSYQFVCPFSFSITIWNLLYRAACHGCLTEWTWSYMGLLSLRGPYETFQW